MDEYQILFNSAFAVLLLGVGWYMRMISETTRDLREVDQDIYEKITQLSVVVPENYVHKLEYRDLNNRIFDKLDRIEKKLDRKVDK